MNSVSYASYCCAKDRDRSEANYVQHMESHQFQFAEAFQVFQRCEPFPLDPRFTGIEIKEEDYPAIMQSIGVPFPDPVMDELTHGWSGPHYYCHHLVNLAAAARAATSEYIILADGDCFMKEQPEGRSWIEEGIRFLETYPDVFVVSPNDGGPERRETIMSQQMFLVNREKFVAMEYIPWDGTFIEGGPFREYFALTEGFVHRHMQKNKMCRYVAPPQWRYWHAEWH